LSTILANTAKNNIVDLIARNTGSFNEFVDDFSTEVGGVNFA
jgi:hypothetical protein